MQIPQQQNDFHIFPWNDNFITGRTQIDEQHRKLVTLLNKAASYLTMGDAAELNRVFEELTAYADLHFKSEEGIWASYFEDDPWLATHQKSHLSFMKEVLEIRQQEIDKPLISVVERIVKFLIKWLAVHILDDDKRMAIVLHNVDAGVSLEEAKRIAGAQLNGSNKVLVDTILAMYDNLSSRTLALMRERRERQRLEEKLQETNRALEILAVTDKLTGLYNRRNFDDVLDREFRRAQREEKLFSFIMIDIDYFKKFNDNYGHAQGDETLKTVGQKLKIICRRPGDFLFRIGGEEFGVLIDSPTQQNAQNFAEMMRVAIEDLNIPHAYSVVSDRVTVSIGLASKKLSSDDSTEKYFAQVDAQLYKAKKEGRNRVVVIS